MSILQNKAAPTPTVEKVVGRLGKMAVNSYSQMLSSYEQTLRAFWRNPNFTPQEIVDGMGADALEFFTLHGKLKAFLLEVNPDAAITDSSTLGTFVVDETTGAITATRVGE